MIARGIITTKNHGVLTAIIISVPRTDRKSHMNERPLAGNAVSLMSKSFENLKDIG